MAGSRCENESGLLEGTRGICKSAGRGGDCSIDPLADSGLRFPSLRLNRTGHWPIRPKRVDWWAASGFHAAKSKADNVRFSDVAPIKTQRMRASQDTSGWFRDNGPGIPAEVVTGILDFAVRVSSREPSRVPTNLTKVTLLLSELDRAAVATGCGLSRSFFEMLLSSF